MRAAFIAALAAAPGRQRLRALSSRAARAVAPRRPAALRMQDEGDGAEEEAPSDTYVAGVEAASRVMGVVDAPKRAELVARVLEFGAVTARGQLATDAQAAAVEDVVAELEEISPNPFPVETNLMDGVWSLVYSSAKLFRSNPFLVAAGTPLLEIGQVQQTIQIDAGTLTTEVDVVAFPAISGTVKTAARITPVGAERLELTVEKTTLTGGSIADRLDLGGISFDVPVEQIYNRVRNASPETFIDTYYLDDKLRISRSKNGKLYIYTRQE